MNKKISQRYQKVLVTVGMGLRTEEDVRKNGLSRFEKKEKNELIQYITELFNKNKSVVALKVKQTGYRSFHININSEEELNNFINNLDNIYENDNEIWVTSSSVLECWRCRIYLSNVDDDLIEMAYSYDDHILDHMDLNVKTPYICYKREENDFKVIKTNLDSIKIKETNLIIKDILNKYQDKLKKIKKDLIFLDVNGISLDIRVNNGYDFHDFDVSYEKTKKVIEFYLSNLNIY